MAGSIGIVCNCDWNAFRIQYTNDMWSLAWCKIEKHIPRVHYGDLLYFNVQDWSCSKRERR